MSSDVRLAMAAASKRPFNPCNRAAEFILHRAGVQWQGTDTEGGQVRIIMVRSFIVGSLMALFAMNFTSVFAASDTSQCRVMDPTGTPLNVRTSPDGRIVGNLPNDMLVTITDHAIDRTGKSWVYISKFSDGKPVGWVFQEFISCN
jgi:hypothetical protein